MPHLITLTPNPALDLATTTAQVVPTHKLRCGPVQRFAGGGGINVARVLHRLGQQAQTDELTGALNRRGLLQHLEAVHAGAASGQAGYALLMVDIDHFKAINDHHGHAEGDCVLKGVSASLRKALRADDHVGRWGGEEFCVLLPRTTLHDATLLAERIARRVSDDGQRVPVTVSIGVSVYTAGDTDLQAVLRRADGALYEAKAAGRDRVVAALS